MVLNLIMFISTYPVMLIVFYVMYVDGKERNGQLFGIRLRDEYKDSPEIDKIQCGFKKQMKRMLIVLMIIPLITFFIPYFSIQITIWILWIFVFIIVSMIPYIIANIRMKSLKEQTCIDTEGSEKRYAELKSVEYTRKVKIKDFIIQLILSIAAVVMVLVKYRQEGIGYCIAIVSIAVVTVAIYYIAVAFDKQKIQVISTDSEINVNYTRAKKNVWKNYWIQCAWINTIYTLLCTVAFFMDISNGNIVLIITVVYSIVLVAILIPIIKKFKNIENSYDDKKNFDYLNDEKHWIWGMFYYNPEDSRTMVDKKIGIGSTTNMATPIGKGLTVFCLLIFIAVPIICGWIIQEEFTPIHLYVNDGKIVAHHVNNDYVINVGTVEDIQLLDNLPSMRRTNGTGMDNLHKGTFSVKNSSSCQVFVNPQNHLFIYFTSDGKTYYFSGINDEETKKVYEEILNVQ